MCDAIPHPCLNLNNISVQRPLNLGMDEYSHPIYFCVVVIFFIRFLNSIVSDWQLRHNLNCQGESMHMKCEPEKVIRIVYANYGRTSIMQCRNLTEAQVIIAHKWQ